MSNKNSKNVFFDVFRVKCCCGSNTTAGITKKNHAHVHFMFMKDMRCFYFPKHKNRQPLDTQTSELFIRTNLILQNDRRSLDTFFLEPGPHDDSHVCVS